MKTIGVVSIGEMGLGIARLMKAHGYEVATFAADRSEGTQSRARSHGITLLPTIDALSGQCDCILSIVPPRDAYTTAERILKPLSGSENPRTSGNPLYYMDLNAVSPKTAREVEALFAPHSDRICLIDGGIIGGVPYPKPEQNGTAGSEATPSWHCPSLIVSGPTKLPDEKLCSILNVDHIEGPVGMATGLKMCFASTTKGMVSLAIQSFTTAHKLGVLPELRGYLDKYNPSTLALCEKGLTTMPSKAYRWVGEMKEIAGTMAEDGGFERQLFDGVSGVYKTVAEDSELGKEQPGARKRGKTVEDVVELLSEGMDAKRRKKDLSNGA